MLTASPGPCLNCIELIAIGSWRTISSSKTCAHARSATAIEQALAHRHTFQQAVIASLLLEGDGVIPLAAGAFRFDEALGTCAR